MILSFFDCSLVTSSSGRMLISCSSGDGLVKFWDCGGLTVKSDRTRRTSTSTEVDPLGIPTSSTTKNSVSDSEALEDDDENEDGEGSSAAVVSTIRGGHEYPSVPSRAFITYSVKGNNATTGSDASCRVSYCF